MPDSFGFFYNLSGQGGKACYSNSSTVIPMWSERREVLFKIIFIFPTYYNWAGIYQEKKNLSELDFSMLLNWYNAI